MAETLLKKDFREKDVQRIRNLVTGQFGNSIITQIGYSKKEEDRKEGDIWEENAKMWTIKDGIKQTYTKLSIVKELVRMPLCCPECGNAMQNKLDKKMYPLHGKCFNCVIEFESKLKREGKYEDYVRQITKGNFITHIEEAEQFIDEFAKSIDDRMVTEAGDIEDHEGGFDKDTMVGQWKKELQEMKEIALQ